VTELAPDTNTTTRDAWAQIVGRIKEALPDMKATSRKIALFVLENPQSVGFSSIQSLGRLIGVNEASIVRFAKGIGFTGYANFKKTVQEAIKNQLNPYGEISLSGFTSFDDERQLSKLIRYESENLKKTMANIRLPLYANIIKEMDNADRIFICGFGSTKYIVELYGFLLTSNFGKQVVPLVGSIADYIGKLNYITKNDILIMVTVPPYSRENSQIAHLAKKKGVRICLFTDSPRCPVYPLSDDVIMYSNASLLYTNSYVGLISSFKVLMDLWLLSKRNESMARMKELTELELQSYKDLATYGE
jgi:DNA-binding MurR/RpiR family transcriptional regulator